MPQSVQQPQRIWRINAYLILIAGVLAVTFMTLGLARLAWDWLRPRAPVADVATPEGDAQPRQERLSYRLRNAQGEVVVLDVLSDPTRDTAYSAKTSAETLRNQVFVTLADDSSTRLLADNQRLIVRVWAIRDTRVAAYHRSESDGDSSEISQPVHARLYEVVEQDSDGNGRLSAGDRVKLLLARADGSAPTVLAESVARLHGAALGADHELRFIAAQADGSTRLHRFDLKGWTALPPVALSSP